MGKLESEYQNSTDDTMTKWNLKKYSMNTFLNSFIRHKYSTMLCSLSTIGGTSLEHDKGTKKKI